jgi:3-oxo-5-alpha-steroid 4-dehydrogenase 1
MGKTSVTSRFNLPGRMAWLTMECPGFMTLLYVLKTLPAEHGITDLPWQNKVLASFFVMHYIYRAVLFPFLQPSISPLHIIVWAFALIFQIFNGSMLGSWLAAYGPTTQAEWRAQWSPFGIAQFALGSVVWFGGLLANYYHDDELREIRRRVIDNQQREEREQQKKTGQQKVSVEKHYQIPQAGLFRYMLYPHYFVEWVEWTGFWMMCGWSCKPAMAFVVNEVFAMLPRAVAGRRWYVQRFGEDKVGKKWAVIPGIW